MTAPKQQNPEKWTSSRLLGSETRRRGLIRNAQPLRKLRRGPRAQSRRTAQRRVFTTRECLTLRPSCCTLEDWKLTLPLHTPKLTCPPSWLALPRRFCACKNRRRSWPCAQTSKGCDRKRATQADLFAMAKNEKERKREREKERKREREKERKREREKERKRERGFPNGFYST